MHINTSIKREIEEKKELILFYKSKKTKVKTQTIDKCFNRLLILKKFSNLSYIADCKEVTYVFLDVVENRLNLDSDEEFKKIIGTSTKPISIEKNLAFIILVADTFLDAAAVLYFSDINITLWQNKILYDFLLYFFSYDIQKILIDDRIALAKKVLKDINYPAKKLNKIFKETF